MPIPFYKPRTKATLVEHLQREHGREIIQGLDSKLRKIDLEDLHRLIHLGRGVADHPHGPAR